MEIERFCVLFWFALLCGTLTIKLSGDKTLVYLHKKNRITRDQQSPKHE